jgi:hypothetical protein
VDDGRGDVDSTKDVEMLEDEEAREEDDEVSSKQTGRKGARHNRRTTSSVWTNYSSTCRASRYRIADSWQFPEHRK